MECLARTRSSSLEISSSTSIIIPVAYKLQYMINSYFEKVFFTNNGNYTSTFRDICNRKRSANTKFIDSMKNALDDWIDKLC